MKILSWNVNGIRAACRNGFGKWFESEQADIVCVQEIKAVQEQLDETMFHPGKYHSYWHSAKKPGYSGVAIYSKKEPLRIQVGLGHPEIDAEGRVLIAEYPEFVLVNAYFPNSQRDHARLDYKLAFCQKFLLFCNQMRAEGKHLVLCGDFNIAHRPIDLRNPKANEKTAGYLPEERAWMDSFLKEDYVDSFRHFTKDPDHYTWWSYRPGVREKNIGWRIDYFIVNKELTDRMKSSVHHPLVKGSDHCPIAFQLKE